MLREIFCSNLFHILVRHILYINYGGLMLIITNHLCMIKELTGWKQEYLKKKTVPDFKIN